MADMDDGALARAVIAGRPGAAERLFDLVFERLYRQVVSRLGGDHVLAEDIVGETLLAGLRGLPGYRARSSLSTWFFRIAQRKIADHHRRRAVAIVSSANGELEKLLDPAESASRLDRLARPDRPRSRDDVRDRAESLERWLRSSQP